MYVCMYVNVCMCMYAYICVCVRTYVCVCVCVYVCMYSYVRMYVCKYNVCMCMCLIVCVSPPRRGLRLVEETQETHFHLQ